MRKVTFIKPSEMSTDLSSRVWKVVYDNWDEISPFTSELTVSYITTASEARRFFMTDPSSCDEMISEFDVFGTKEIKTVVEVLLDPVRIQSCKVITK